MTANPKLMLHERLDAMVDAIEKKAQQESCDGSLPIGWRIQPLTAIALDLLSKLDAVMARADAAEAQVESLKLETKALTKERDALVMDACIGAAIISAFRGEPVSDFEESFPDVMEAKMARAALKLGGE